MPLVARLDKDVNIVSLTDEEAKDLKDILGCICGPNEVSKMIFPLYSQLCDALGLNPPEKYPARFQSVVCKEIPRK